jgi:hypothetical protein
MSYFSNKRFYDIQELAQKQLRDGTIIKRFQYSRTDKQMMHVNDYRIIANSYHNRHQEVNAENGTYHPYTIKLDFVSGLGIIGNRTLKAYDDDIFDLDAIDNYLVGKVKETLMPKFTGFYNMIFEVMIIPDIPIIKKTGKYNKKQKN